MSTREDDALIIEIGKKFEDLTRQMFSPARGVRQLLLDAVAGERITHLAGDVEPEGRGARGTVLVLTDHFAAVLRAQKMPGTMTQSMDTGGIAITVLPRSAVAYVKLEVPGWSSNSPYDGTAVPWESYLEVSYAGLEEPLRFRADRDGVEALRAALLVDLTH